MVLCSLRRAFLAVTILATLTPALRAAMVSDGVAAGDVSPTGAILWTRAENGGSPTDLTAQVATDPGFGNIVSAISGTTDAASDFTLKLDATGLTANTQYYYRFLAPDGGASTAGQFTTAPTPDQKVDVKFGFSGDADARFRPRLCENSSHDKIVTRFSGGGRDEAFRRGGGSWAVDVVSRMPG